MDKSFYQINVECTSGHKQQLYVAALLGMSYAKNFASTLDCSDPMFVVKPKVGDGGILGKCAICREKGVDSLITATVNETPVIMSSNGHQ